MTSATPKPRAGEHTPSNTPETDAHERWLREEGSSSDYLPELVTANFARALEAERDSLREREKALIDVLGKLLDVTKRANIEVPMSDAPVFFAARDLLANHGR